MKKALDISVAIIFIIFAIVQWNDPDPMIWILMYLCVASIPIMNIIGRRNMYYEYALILILVIALATYMPSIFQWLQDGMPSITSEMKADTPYVEWVREALGLLISLIAVGLYRLNKN